MNKKNHFNGQKTVDLINYVFFRHKDESAFNSRRPLFIERANKMSKNILLVVAGAQILKRNTRGAEKFIHVCSNNNNNAES